MKKDLMKKLKMPDKAKDPMLDDMPPEASDLDSPDSPEAPMPDMPEGEGKETPEEEIKELHQIDDDMLVQELEKRGFTVQRPEKGEESQPEEAQESPEQESAEMPV